MTLVNYGLIREGDWISGTSQTDEKFIGYVESMSENSVLKVVVTQCDREETVGTTIQTMLAKVKKLPDNAPASPDEIRSLIEFALEMHDKDWFEELSAKLVAVAPPTQPFHWSEKQARSNPRLFGIAPGDRLDV